MTSNDRGRLATPSTSAPSGSWPSQVDPRVASALEDYIAQLQGGNRPSRSVFLARYPEIADALAECLAGLELVQSAAADLSSTEDPPVSFDVLPPWTRLGDFLILGEIGRGGMGVVYSASQVSLGRRVALKVLPTAAAIDPKQRQRFQVEAQAAALLHHPHIVPVFAVGSDRGISYYAMQFINGRTLAEAIQEIRHTRESAERGKGLVSEDDTIESGDAKPTSDSPEAGGSAEASSFPSTSGREFFRSTARLGIQAAEALEHAHGLGVLHRDIKPANLLLDERGELWVTDFGLARFRDDPGPTRTGDLLGTLRYMSPEQLQARRGVVDQRADVYALGATLYELATLQPAFEGRDREELLGKILAEEPPPPRKIHPSIPRDLETILLRAMAKEPASRYATAQDLADDLARFLDDKPILARRPSMLEQGAKWVRRHRSIVATAVTVLLLAAAVGSALFWREQGRTAKALEEAKQSLALHSQSMDLLLRAAYTLTMKAMAAVTSHGGGEIKAEDRPFFQEALQFYEDIERMTRDDPRQAEIMAKAQFGQGLTRMLLGLPDAEEAYLRSVNTYEMLAARQGRKTDLLWNMVSSLEYLALRIQSDPARGLDAAKAIHERVLTLKRELVTREPSNKVYRAALSRHLTDWAQALTLVGRRKDAEKNVREAFEIQHRSPDASNNLAWHLALDPEAGPAKFAEAATLARAAVTASPKIGAYWNTLGLALVRSEDWKGAVEAAETSRRLGGEGEAYDWLVLAIARSHLGDPDRAREAHIKAVQWMKAHPAADPALERLRDETAKRLGQPRPANP
jgi:serine/threonine protein kinase